MRPGPAALLALMTMLAASEGAAQESADGERLFRQRCAQCHALDAGAAKVGPHLDGIIGRKAGSVAGARYSRALPQSQIVWDEATLDSFLANPRKLVTGTTMMVGVPNDVQRKAIIAYLKSVPAAPK
jgi:cytochrome c